MYKGTRYRGYVYINPSKMKVIKTVYSDEGIGVDNVYYDNVIHICVYEGKKLLYGKDITKKSFRNYFSGGSIKSDHSFRHEFYKCGWKRLSL